MPFGWQQIESPLSLEECSERLQEAIDPSNLLDLPAGDGTKAVYGYIENGWFELRQRGPGKEQGFQALQGQILSGGCGTILRFRCAWDDGPRWACWLSVIVAVAFSVGTWAVIAYTYLVDSHPGPRPYAWMMAILPLVVVPAAIIGVRRTVLVAHEQRAFLVAFLEYTVKAVAKLK
jgi:hypothetical protein